MNDGKIRCSWCPPDDNLYVKYHDEEWGVPVHDDGKLFEMLVLESFQAGLSWRTILGKREAFRRAFDGFDAVTVAGYGEDKISALMSDASIVRNRRKIEAAIKNARVYLDIAREFGSFDAYLRSFTCGKVTFETGLTSYIFPAVGRDIGGSIAARYEIRRYDDNIRFPSGGRHS